MKKLMLIIALILAFSLGCEKEPVTLSVETSLIGDWKTIEFGMGASIITLDGINFFEKTDFEGIHYDECNFTRSICTYTKTYYYTKYKLHSATEWRDTSFYEINQKSMRYVVTDNAIIFLDMNSSSPSQYIRGGLIHVLTEDYLELTVELAQNNGGFCGTYEFYRVQPF